jgi:hypothetical protein
MHGPTCIFWANLTPFSLQLKLAERRTQLYFGHPGAFFPETSWHLLGTYSATTYFRGVSTWKRPAAAENGAIRMHYTGTLELCALMLEAVLHTRLERRQVGPEVGPISAC